MAIASVLNQRVTIQRKTVTYSVAGEPTLAWTTVATGVSCALDAVSGHLTRGTGGWVRRETIRGFFESDTDLQIEDRVIVGAEAWLVGNVTDAAGRGHHLEAVLVKPQ